MHRDILNLRKSGMQSNKLPWRGKASLKQKASGQKSSFDLLVQSLPYQVKSFEPLQFDIPANVKVYGPVPQPPASSEASNSHLFPLAQMAARQKVAYLCFYIGSERCPQVLQPKHSSLHPLRHYSHMVSKQ